MGCTPEPVIQSCDTGQLVPYSDSCQYNYHNMDVQYQVQHNLYAGLSLRFQVAGEIQQVDGESNG